MPDVFDTYYRRRLGELQRQRQELVQRLAMVDGEITRALDALERIPAPISELVAEPVSEARE